jgi:type I restriction enzyme S subunit
VFIDEATDEEMQQTRVRPRDVLLNITGASIGRTAIVPDTFPPANVNQHVCIIRVREGIYPAFVSYALKARTVKDQIQGLNSSALTS